MTTYDEISTSALENYKYWTEQAISYLSIYRERKSQDTDKHLIDSAKSSFRTMMRLRRAQEYLK